MEVKHKHLNIMTINDIVLLVGTVVLPGAKFIYNIICTERARRQQKPKCCKRCKNKKK